MKSIGKDLRHININLTGMETSNTHNFVKVTYIYICYIRIYTFLFNPYVYHFITCIISINGGENGIYIYIYIIYKYKNNRDITGILAES